MCTFTSLMNFLPPISVVTYTKINDLLFNSYCKTASESTLNAAKDMRSCFLKDMYKTQMTSLWIALYLALVPGQRVDIHQ